MKNLGKVVIFICVLIGCLVVVQIKLSYEDQLGTQKICKDFYRLEKNSVDVVSLGTSAVQRGWLVPEAFNELGISSYTMATASQPFCLTKYIMEEVNKRQNPKVFLVDIRAAIEKPDDMQEAFIRRVTDNFRDSKLRFEAVKYALDFAKKGKNDINTKDTSYYISLEKYHELYNPAKKPEKANVKYFNGFAYLESSYYNAIPQVDVGIVETRAEMDKNSVKVLNDLLDYCDKIDAKTIFTMIPFSGTREELEEINTAIRIVRKRGYKCINFLDGRHRAAIGVNFNKFFYNSRHTNYYGSEQYTLYMGKLLKEKYGVPDRTNDSKCKRLARRSKKFIKISKRKKRRMYSAIFSNEYANRKYIQKRREKK